MERMVGTYEVGDVRITGLADKHMSSAVGKTRWTEVQRDLDEDFSPPDNKLHMDNIIYAVETGGITLVHWGDNRPVPDEFVAQWLRENPIDAIFLPVDESEHILGYTQADAIMDSYEPALTIPIHYRLPGVNTALSTLQPRNRGCVGTRTSSTSAPHGSCSHPVIIRGPVRQLPPSATTTRGNSPLRIELGRSSGTQAR